MYYLDMLYPVSLCVSSMTFSCDGCSGCWHLTFIFFSFLSRWLMSFGFLFAACLRLVRSFACVCACLLLSMVASARVRLHLVNILTQTYATEILEKCKYLLLLLDVDDFWAGIAAAPAPATLSQPSQPNENEINNGTFIFSDDIFLCNAHPHFSRTKFVRGFPANGVTAGRLLWIALTKHGHACIRFFLSPLLSAPFSCPFPIYHSNKSETYRFGWHIDIGQIMRNEMRCETHTHTHTNTLWI